jgi:GPI-anchor transamidase subunit U
MFDHFRTLFLYTFQINATILYLFPLSLKLQHQPIMLATILTALTAIFRSYPCVGDIGFYMALLPIWKNCSKCTHFYLLFSVVMSHNFVVGATFLVTSVLAPTVWHLWIYANSANANFYFGVTLIFCTAQVSFLCLLNFFYISNVSFR